MKFQTSALTGMMLDFACAQFDSHCEGLTWELRGDHYVGLYNENYTKTICTIIFDGNFHRLLEICREYKLQYRLVYSPSTKWEHGGPLIEAKRIALIASLDDGWQSANSDVFGVPMMGETPLIAAMRYFVQSNSGDTIELGGAI